MKKNAITIIASEETYQNLSTFTDIEELNKTVRQYKEKFHDKLTKSSLLVLDQLHRYSAKYIGVSFLTKNHIAQSLNISRKTVQRACKVLEDIGVIKQLEMKRQSDMRQTSNAIVIQPIVEDVQQDNSDMSHQKDNISLKQNHNKKEIRTEDKPVHNQPKIILDWVNKQFAQFASYFFSETEIVELWRISHIHSRKFDMPSCDLVELSIQSLKALVNKMKGKQLDSVFGYYNGIIKLKFKVHWLHNAFNSYMEA
jgi:Fe2+ or Zn2+ uptake regulation protein